MSEPSFTRSGVHRRRGEGKSFWLITDLITFKAVGEDTNGAFTVTEVSAGPDIGPPPHIHRHADECFHILEGTFEFSLAGEAFTAAAGSFVYLPKGVIHTHKAGGAGPARALVTQVPSGVEHFIQEAGTPATDPSARPGPPTASDLERVLSAAEKYGIDVPRE